MNGRAVLVVAALAAAVPAAAQRGTEWQAGGLATLAPAGFVGGVVGWARRASRVRVGVGMAAGVLEGAAAARGELVVGYLLTPGRRQGVGVYAAGGLALTATRNGRAERLVALVGVEQAPARRHGWFVEAGVSGGLRLAAGWRWRTLRR